MEKEGREWECREKREEDTGQRGIKRGMGGGGGGGGGEEERRGRKKSTETCMR